MIENAIAHENHVLAKLFPDYEIAVAQINDRVTCAVVIGTKSDVPASIFYCDEAIPSFWTKAGTCFAERITEFEIVKGYRGPPQ